MGEKSKIIGDVGENIAKHFLELIGWNNPLQNQSIPCSKSKKHANQNSVTEKSYTHGVDNLYVYKSPLENYTTQNVIFSVKNTDGPYPKSATQLFKSHFQDIAETIECYGFSEIKSQQSNEVKGSRHTRTTGVLFWLSGHEDTKADVVSRVKNAQIDSDLVFDSIHLVDNKQVEFLYQVITFLRTKYEKSHIEFYYPKTSLNYEDKNIKQHGKILPVEFITSPIIPFAINTSDEDLTTIVLASIDMFEKSALAQLIQLGKEYSSEINCHLVIAFPNFLGKDHDNDVSTVLRGFVKTDNINVISYNPNHRSLGNDR